VSVHLAYYTFCMSCFVASVADVPDPVSCLIDDRATCGCDVRVTWRGHVRRCRGAVGGRWWPWRRWWSARWRFGSAAPSWRRRWARGWSTRSTASCVASAWRCPTGAWRPSTPFSDFSTRRCSTDSCASCRRPGRPSTGTESAWLCDTDLSVHSRHRRRRATRTLVVIVASTWLHLSSISEKTVSISTLISQPKVRRLSHVFQPDPVMKKKNISHRLLTSVVRELVPIYGASGHRGLLDPIKPAYLGVICCGQPTYQIWSLYLHPLQRYERQYKMLKMWCFWQIWVSQGHWT